MPRRRRGKDGAQLVRLLLGGDKSTQTADVARAPEFWKGEQDQAS